MTIYLSGGSNTLHEKGWVSQFRALIGDHEAVRNISIGASPSMMAAWRCLKTVDLTAQDTVIWEYGINDAMHIDRKGPRKHKEQDLVRAVEWLLQHCAKTGTRFAALIFQTRLREKTGELGTYRELLHALFNRYGVPYFDVPQEFVATRPKQTRIPARLFRDKNHYDADSPLMRFIARGAAQLAQQAAVPAAVSAMEEARPVFLSGFEGGLQEVFENSIVSTPAWQPNGGGAMTTVMPSSGRLIGLVLIATKQGGIFDLGIGGTVCRLSGTFKEKAFDRPMVKFISLSAVLGEDVIVPGGTPISISWASDKEGMVSDFGFQSNPAEEAVSAREARIISLLAELDS